MSQFFLMRVAEVDLEEILFYIGERNPSAASKMSTGFLSKFAMTVVNLYRSEETS
jgi:plasmid stabilization system protein ParE